MSTPFSGCSLPPGVKVFERGWLSANNILFEGREQTAIVDSGYASHSAQTVALVKDTLGPRSLDLVLNTHLHSDHCGGNASLQAAYTEARTLIPPGLARFVREWDPIALTYVPTGQECPRFKFDGLLVPGQEIELADLCWQIHAAPGHDPNSIILFEPSTQTLISADALWENGFGIVFEELEGVQAFDEVAATFDLIESLSPRVVLPGHGAVFDDVRQALRAARSKLESYVRDPVRHARHAGKVLLKFKLLDIQQLPVSEFNLWAAGVPYFQMLHQRFFARATFPEWLDELTADLVRSGAARRNADLIRNG